MATKPAVPGQTVHHQPVRKKRRAPGGGNMSVNMTPMIDVTFLLLIFFVVATNFVREGVLFSKLPEVSNATPDPTPPLTLELAERGQGNARLYVNNSTEVIFKVGEQNKVSAHMAGDMSVTLTEYLRSLHQTYNPETTTINVKPRDDVSWEFVICAYNSALSAGYKQINWSGD